MGDTADKISIKLLVDKENNKVVLAEAGEYFVKVLLSFLSYPIGSVIRNSVQNSMVGCIDALYKSVDALDIQYFQTEACKDKLVSPTWECSISTKIHYYSKICGQTKCCRVDHKITPLDESAIFMITDDLHVKKISIETGVQILNQMGITDVSVLEEKITSFTNGEVMDLLSRSLQSKTPITDVFLKPTDEIVKNTKMKIKTEPLDEQFLSLDQTVLHDCIEKISLKLLISKSKNKVLYAVANAEFVDLLFSILAFPWETMIELFCGCSSIVSMDNLYKSEEKLCDEYPEQFTKDKKIPFNPKCEGGYVKATTIFMVTDELTVEPFSLVSSISFINKLDVPLSDLEERTAAVGEQEALSVVKASLTTTTPLTHVFCKKK